jgi:hypothetical protein
MAQRRPLEERPIYHKRSETVTALGPAWGTGCSHQPASSHVRRTPFSVSERLLQVDHGSAGSDIVLNQVPELNQ